MPVEAALLHKANGDLEARLADGGLRVSADPRTRGLLRQALAGVRSGTRATLVPRPGWAVLADGSRGYVFPDGGTAGGAGETLILHPPPENGRRRSRGARGGRSGTSGRWGRPGPRGRKAGPRCGPWRNERRKRAAASESGQTRHPVPCQWRTMPNFFSHVRDGDRLIEDPEGADLPDLDAARAEAATAARQLRGDALLRGGAMAGRAFEVADEAGRVLATVAIKDVLDSH